MVNNQLYRKQNPQSPVLYHRQFLWCKYSQGYFKLRTWHFCHLGRNVYPNLFFGLPGGSDGKESACNAGDPSSIPGLGRSPGEGIGYPFQYSWPSLVAQGVKNPPAMQDTWVQSLGWEDPSPGGGHGNPLQYSCLETPH